MANPEQTEQLSFLFSPDYYDSEIAAAVLALHQRATKEHSGHQQYFNFSINELKPIWEHSLGKGVKIIISRVEDMPSELTAALVHEQMKTYVKKDTMGDFPKENEKAWEELTAVFSQEDPDSVWVFCLAESKQGFLPFSGSRIVYGKDSIENWSLNGHPDTLPTQAALLVKEGILAETEYGQTLECMTVCLTRFFSCRKKLENLDINSGEYSKVAFEIVAYLAIAVALTKPNTEYAVIDTHEESIVRMLENYFSGTIIANNGELTPTQTVLDSILKHHYNYFKDSLWIVAMKMDEFLETAITYLEKNNKPMPKIN